MRMTEASLLDPVNRAVRTIGSGGMAIVVDDGDRENEGDLIMAADHATPEALAFMIRHTTGIVCVALAGELVDALELPPMTARNSDRHCTAFTVSVDLRMGTTTGVSAADRALTIRALADPATKPGDLARPGHVFPLRARPGGVLERRGHTEASVDLARMAGCQAAGVLCEIMNDDGTMARLPELVRFGERFGLPIVSIAELVRARTGHPRSVASARSARAAA